MRSFKQRLSSLGLSKTQIEAIDKIQSIYEKETNKTEQCFCQSIYNGETNQVENCTCGKCASVVAYKEGYLAGGKAERERTKKLIDDIHKEFKRDVLKLTNPALSLAAGIEIKINKYEEDTKGVL